MDITQKEPHFISLNSLGSPVKDFFGGVGGESQINPRFVVLDHIIELYSKLFPDYVLMRVDRCVNQLSL